MDPDRLAELLADRFAAIVPSGFQVSAENGMLRYSSISTTGRGSSISGSYIAGNFGNGDTEADRITWCAEEVLGQLQDFVDEKSAEPWPGERTVPPAHAAVRGSRLHLWFGDADSPVLECEPIDIE